MSKPVTQDDLFTMMQSWEDRLRGLEKASQGAVPAGTLAPTACPIVPAGWIWCDGSAISRTQYPDLFNAITVQFVGTLTNGSNSVTGLPPNQQIYAGQPISGPGIPAATTVASVVSSTSITISKNATLSGVQNLVVAPWGVGDGSTTFNVPDSQGRVAMGTQWPTYLLGFKGGEAAHTLTGAELPPHSHTNPNIGIATSAIGESAGMYHRWGAWDIGVGDATGSNGTYQQGQGPTGNGPGTSTPHNNLPPYFAANYMIKL